MKIHPYVSCLIALSFACLLASDGMAGGNSRNTGLKEWWTPGCVAPPLPTQPTGETSSIVASGTYAAGTFTARVTAWRVACGGGDYQTLFTFTPQTGQVYPTAMGVTLIQRGFQYDSYIVTSGPLLVTETSRIGSADGSPGAPEFDDDLAFEVVFADLLFGTLSRLQVPAAPGGPAGNLTLRGAMSGSWYDQSRPGQGLMLEFGKVGTRRVAFVTWYAQIAGQQAWIVGNRDYSEGDSALSLDLFRTQGGTFPTAGGSAGSLVPWGTGTIRFPTCGQLTLSFQSASEGNGQIQMVRGMEGGIDGLSCGN